MNFTTITHFNLSFFLAIQHFEIEFFTIIVEQLYSVFELNNFIGVIVTLKILRRVYVLLDISYNIHILKI